jgi:arginyl-tRNA synthetase
VPFFAEVRSVGIYVNARLPDSHFFQALEQVVRLDAHFGKSDEGRSQNIAIDYSSPNAAKHLHAGHIRSTIIGHVLGNMYEACGYTVHRINYLNDWGGMGVLIEGLSLRDDEDSYENKNDLLFEIYSTFRKAQKLSADEGAFEKLLESEKEELSRLVGEFAGYEDFVRKYAAFSERANARFAALETGDDGEFATWRKIVEWSILDFERFYQMLDIHQEYLTGESLYAQSGKDFVMRQVEKGGVIFFDERHAREALAIVQAQQEAETITSEVFERKKQEIEADIGCYVVPIGNDERYVVLKKDGSTIYATRDLAALEHRISVFSPKKLVYEVGQEQQEHFDKLFRAARQLGMVDSDVGLLHIYHGFYVDEATKKKLSSRD